jgi:pyruvate kinase
MIRAGMDVARLNFAHGDRQQHSEIVTNVREAARGAGRRVTLIGDLPGPKMRIGRLADERTELERGRQFVLQTAEVAGDSIRAWLNFPEILEAVRPGDKIYVNDGSVELAVRQVARGEVRCEVIVGGEIRSGNGVNFPGIDLGVVAFTERDREHLAFAAEAELDGVSQSFVQDAADILAVRAESVRLGYSPLIIAKIERAQAVANLEEILEQADGIMVARGDLGVETPIEQIAITQKRIIRLANAKAKPVITATHMLESMREHRQPTRAEATDVANAILDGTDCVMLSGETAIGKHPLDSVDVICRIARATEPHMTYGLVADDLERAREQHQLAVCDLVALSVYRSAQEVEPSAIMCPTLSGRTARCLSRFRFPIWVIAVSPNRSTCRRLQLSWGVVALHESQRPDSWEKYCRRELASFGISDGLALLTQGTGTAHGGGTNQIGFVQLGEPPGQVRIW